MRFPPVSRGVLTVDVCFWVFFFFFSFFNSSIAESTILTSDEHFSFEVNRHLLLTKFLFEKFSLI